MKIPLRFNQNESHSSKAASDRILENDILESKKGNWGAKKKLAQTFSPLINSLAGKRSDVPAEINKYVEAGKNGLFTAAKKYKKSIGPKKFQIFALDFIEVSMNRADQNGGFLSRLFGKKN